MNHLYDGLLADKSPDAPFAEIPGDPPRHLTYGGLADASGRYANALLARGVARGDRVAVQVKKSIEAVVVYLATVRIGAVFLPLNTAYTVHEVDYFLTNAEPALFVCDPAREGEYAALAGRLGVALATLGAAGDGALAAEAAAAPGACDTARCGPGDLAAILYTSGTTGRSKGAMLSHDNLLSNARTLADLWRFTSADVLIHALPIFHTHGLFVATNIVLTAGAAMVFLPGFTPDAVLAAMPRASALMGVPTFYTRLLAEPGLTREAAQGMRLFVSGSAPLLAETHLAWRERTGHAILERYGMTETNMNTSNPYEGERRAGTVGFPLPDVDVRVVGEDGTPLGAGAIGSIEVRGPNVFGGYWRMPEKTAEEMRPDGFFITGDVGMFDAEGYLTIVGRSKDLVISGGFNVYPKEVEEAIDALPGVLESAVIGVPHPDFGEGVTAVVVPREGAAVSEAAVLAALGDQLARYKQPKRVFVVDELPRNTMGKVQKAALRERFRATYDA
ncbi:MAG: malonyl-CoA synthase [Acuticoccus sp.]